MNGNGSFDKMLFNKMIDLLEKDVVAWDRCYNKLEHIDDILRRLAETIEKKIDMDEKLSRWLKLITGMFGLIATIAGTTAVVLNIVR